MATRMQQRRGTAAQWISTNAGAGPVLNAGEIGWESDTNKFKIGDGVNNWTSLDYFSDINSTVNPAFGSSITFEGATANDFETTLAITDPTADRTITIPDVTGTVITTGNLSDITNIGVFTSTITMEGSTANDFELTLSAGDPTADRTVTFPDATGTVALTSDVTTHANLTEAHGATGAVVGTTNTQTLTNKTLTSPKINEDVAVTATATELNYVDGVTSAIQTQLDDKSTASKTETLTNKTLTSPVVSGLTLSDGSIVLEGATANDFETTLTVTDPTADRTITFPDATGTVALTSDIAVTASSTTTFSNKSISLATNTVTGTKAEFNSAMSDADFATIAGSETLTNKTLTSPVITGAVFNDGSIVFEGATANDHETTFTITDPTADRTITFPDETGTVQLRVTDVSDTEIGYLNGVTSAIQTQMDAKAPLAAPALTGDATAVNLTISGNLTVNGTTTNINSTNLVVEDKNIVLADVETPSDTTADGGGITLKGLTDKTFNWVDATDSWTSSEHINLASGKSYFMNGTALKDVSETLTNKTLTTPVISSISNTGTLTLPTSTDTLVGRATTDTLTNKSISLTTNTITGTIAEFNSAVTDQDLATLAGTETLTNKTLGSAVATTAFTLNATAELRLADTDSTHYVGFKAPGTITTNKIWTLPAADGAAGQVLTTNGSGTFSFSTPASGAAFSEFMLIGA